MTDVKINVQRGNDEKGLSIQEFTVDAAPGMVVLDVIHLAQAKQAPDLAVRWNCKAGKCGSCSAEVNGKPVLLCMTKVSNYPAGTTLDIRPLATFPIIKDLVTDVSWNYKVNQKIKKYKHPKIGHKYVNPENGEGIVYQHQVDRVQEYRKCIECYLCQNVCHVLRTHNKKENFAGPRFMARLASLEMHPLDQEKERLKDVKNLHGVGYCNITRCCTEVCPESIKITDNAIIPLKERVVDEFYDPIAKFGKTILKLFKTK
jgi:succinate dehydrogenase / fumarate reductase, iron-sulfur subunit